MIGKKTPFYGMHHTKAMKEKRRQQELGKTWSKTRKDKRRGSTNPFFGKKHTKEAWAKTHAGFRRYIRKLRRLKELAKRKGGNSHV